MTIDRAALPDRVVGGLLLEDPLAMFFVEHIERFLLYVELITPQQPVWKLWSSYVCLVGKPLNDSDLRLLSDWWWVYHNKRAHLHAAARRREDGGT